MGLHNPTVRPNQKICRHFAHLPGYATPEAVAHRANPIYIEARQSAWIERTLATRSPRRTCGTHQTLDLPPDKKDNGASLHLHECCEPVNGRRQQLPVHVHAAAEIAVRSRAGEDCTSGRMHNDRTSITAASQQTASEKWFFPSIVSAENGIASSPILSRMLYPLVCRGHCRES